MRFTCLYIHVHGLIDKRYNTPHLTTTSHRRIIQSAHIQKQLMIDTLLASEESAGYTVVSTAGRAGEVGGVPGLHVVEVASMPTSLTPHKQTPNCTMTEKKQRMRCIILYTYYHTLSVTLFVIDFKGLEPEWSNPSNHSFFTPLWLQALQTCANNGAGN